MTDSARDVLPQAFTEVLSEDDIEANSSLQSPAAIDGHLEVLTRHAGDIDTVLDIGCNRGGFVTALGNHLDATDIYGIEIDDELRSVATERGVEAYDVNVESEPLPFDENSIDLVLSFGLIEHLRYYDHLFAEIAHVLDEGWLWISAPNLASWINRFALLTGHQPRNVELSQEEAVGILPVYESTNPIDHVHAPTYGALVEYLDLHGFDVVERAPLTPYQPSRLVRVLDRIFNLRIQWSRRVLLLMRQR